MSTYPNLNRDPEFIKIKTRDDEIKNLKYQNEKHDHENVIKSLKVDNEYYKKEYKSINKKNVLLIITELLIGAGSAVASSPMALINPGAGIVVSSSTTLLTSIAILITNEYISKLKIRYITLRDRINVITLLYEKTLKQSVVDKKIDEKEAQEMKKIYNHYLDRRKEIMKNTQFKREDVFGDVISKDNFSQEQIYKLNSFLAKTMCIKISKLICLNLERRKILTMNPVLLPIMNNI